MLCFSNTVPCKQETNMAVTSMMTCKIYLIWRHMKTLPFPLPWWTYSWPSYWHSCSVSPLFPVVSAASWPRLLGLNWWNHRRCWPVQSTASPWLSTRTWRGDFPPGKKKNFSGINHGPSHLVRVMQIMSSGSSPTPLQIFLRKRAALPGTRSDGCGMATLKLL